MHLNGSLQRMGGGAIHERENCIIQTLKTECVSSTDDEEGLRALEIIKCLQSIGGTRSMLFENLIGRFAVRLGTGWFFLNSFGSENIII